MHLDCSQLQLSHFELLIKINIVLKIVFVVSVYSALSPLFDLYYGK